MTTKKRRKPLHKRIKIKQEDIQKFIFNYWTIIGMGFIACFVLFCICYTVIGIIFIPYY
jgi:hypothetical protein